ncbi:MAG: GspH/FimT family pseudopilin [Gemmatimonadales bacterium]
MSRSGTTLIDQLLAMVVIGLLVAVAAPRLAYLADEAAVRGEAARIVGALDAARGAAVRLDRNASLELMPARWIVWARYGIDSMIAWQSGGNASAGVTLSGAGAPIVFGRAGIAVGASNRTLVVSRGSASRRVIISRLGRITP